MTTARVDAAVTVKSPPVNAAADATHQAGVIFRVDQSTSCVQATAADIPKECRGRYWRLLTIGANVDWGWLMDSDGVGGADSAPALVYGQKSATGTGHLAAQPTLLDSVPEHVYCPPGARRLVFISSAAGIAPGASFTASISGEQTGSTTR